MFKTIASVFTTLSLLAAANAQACNGTQYLEVTLWDSFGDGWDEAYWMMRDPAGLLSQEQSTCWEIEKKFEVHPCDHDPRSGFYYMTVNSMDEELPEGWWEVYWKVEVFWANGTSAGDYYEGVYNTTMVWEYDEVADRWTLTHYDGIPDFECDGCSGGACEPKTKPKPKSKSNKKGGKKGSPLKGKGHKGADSEDEVSSNSTESSSEAIKYGPRAVNLEVKMYDDVDAEGNCNGWNDINRIGAHWYISDYTKTKVFDDGSLCEGCAGSCQICLGDGSYVFRVTGPTFNETLEDIWWDKVGGEPDSEVEGSEDHSVLDEYRAPYTAWEFCHAKGFFNDQLNFHVKKGKCIPDDLRWADEICDAQENSTVTLNGVIALAGITSEIFSSRDYHLVLSDLSAAVDGWNFKLMSVTATSLDVRSLSAGKRALNSYTHDIEFSVTFVAEDFGVDGATYAIVENLVSDMSSTLEASFNSGTFITALAMSARSSSSDLLSEVNYAELVSLDITQIAYAHTRLVYYYNEDEASVSSSSSSSSSSSISSQMIVLVVGVAAFAFVAFVGVATHGFNGYSKVSPVSDTEHEMNVVRSPFGTSVTNAKSSSLQVSI